MKLSTKIILPIILISALLILLNGCFGVPDDSPAYTLGSIQGTMARPEECCYDPEAELADDPISPNICDVDWYAWANVKVVLTTWVDSVEIELATTVTDENGAYLFSDVPPAKNYIITAICPTDEGFVIKDVAEEVVGGETYDAGIADAESTVLALCLEGLGEIGSDSYLLDLDDFQSHSDYNKVIEEVCDYLANCEHAIPSWVNVLTGLSPGFTEDTEEGVFIGGTGGGYVPTTVYDLTMEADPAIGGTATDVTGTSPYAADTVVSISAEENGGYVFVGWTAPAGTFTDASVADTTFTMPAQDVTVTATFSEIPTPQYTLTVTIDGGGSVDLSPPGGTYSPGTEVTLTPQADPCWVFDHWEGDLSGNTNPEIITMNSDKAVTAVFVQVQEEYTLTVTTVGEGSVTKDPDLDTYSCGTDVKLTATADPCWSFEGWTVDLVSTNNPEDIIMNSDKNVTATFTESEPCFLSSLSLKDDHDATKEYLSFDPGTPSYRVEVFQNVARMNFTAESSCIIKYMFAGGSCGEGFHVTTWTDIDVPQWIHICNNGDNVLEIRVSEADGSRENIYTITIVPRENPQ